MACGSERPALPPPGEFSKPSSIAPAPSLAVRVFEWAEQLPVDQAAYSLAVEMATQMHLHPQLVVGTTEFTADSWISAVTSSRPVVFSSAKESFGYRCTLGGWRQMLDRAVQRLRVKWPQLMLPMGQFPCRQAIELAFSHGDLDAGLLAAEFFGDSPVRANVVVLY